jgi:hypothetical protein
MASRPTERRTEDAVISTTGEIFADGTIELVLRDMRTGPELLLSTRKKCTIAPQVKHAGSIYQVPYLHPTIVRATRLASGISDYGTTQRLIESIEGLLQEYIGLLTSTAHLLVLWILSTWLADCVPSPLCLVVSGFDMGVAVKLLSLLKCLVRRPLLLTEISPAGFGSVVTILHPTALINQPQLSRKVRDFWRCSNFGGVFVAGSGGVVHDVSCAKALFVETEVISDPWSDGTLHIALLPVRDALPPLDAWTQSMIADEFLAKLMFYRLQNIPKVQESILAKDPWRPTNADTLRACVLDDPEFTQKVLPLLQAQHEDTRSRARLDPNRTIVEILWTPTHEKVDLNPGKIADLLNA